MRKERNQSGKKFLEKEGKRKGKNEGKERGKKKKIELLMNEEGKFIRPDLGG